MKILFCPEDQNRLFGIPAACRSIFRVTMHKVFSAMVNLLLQKHRAKIKFLDKTASHKKCFLFGHFQVGLAS